MAGRPHSQVVTTIAKTNKPACGHVWRERDLYFFAAMHRKQQRNRFPTPERSAEAEQAYLAIYASDIHPVQMEKIMGMTIKPIGRSQLTSKSSETELGSEQLDAVSGGWTIDFTVFKISSDDIKGAVKGAATWAANHIK